MTCASAVDGFSTNAIKNILQLQNGHRSSKEIEAIFFFSLVSQTKNMYWYINWKRRAEGRSVSVHCKYVSGRAGPWCKKTVGMAMNGESAFLNESNVLLSMCLPCMPPLSLPISHSIHFLPLYLPLTQPHPPLPHTCLLYTRPLTLWMGTGEEGPLCVCVCVWGMSPCSTTGTTWRPMKGLDNVTDQQQDNIDNRLLWYCTKPKTQLFFCLRKKKKNLCNENQL